MKGNEIKRVLKKLKMSQNEFGRRIGVSSAAIARYANDQRKMHPVMAMRIRQVAEELLKKAS